ncbi:hypothetical protein BC826DRAFT_159134 [Russula brevipes]|nr:hypothetical protein BC826DRAFT_159134 [Russula brevipes]
MTQMVRPRGLALGLDHLACGSYAGSSVVRWGCRTIARSSVGGWQCGRQTPALLWAPPDPSLNTIGSPSNPSLTHCRLYAYHHFLLFLQRHPPIDILTVNKVPAQPVIINHGLSESLREASPRVLPQSRREKGNTPIRVPNRNSTAPPFRLYEGAYLGEAPLIALQSLFYLASHLSSLASPLVSNHSGTGKNAFGEESGHRRESHLCNCLDVPRAPCSDRISLVVCREQVTASALTIDRRTSSMRHTDFLLRGVRKWTQQPMSKTEPIAHNQPLTCGA